jgi:hypothetical protein
MFEKRVTGAVLLDEAGGRKGIVDMHTFSKFALQCLQILGKKFATPEIRSCY